MTNLPPARQWEKWHVQSPETHRPDASSLGQQARRPETTDEWKRKYKKLQKMIAEVDQEREDFRRQMEMLERQKREIRRKEEYIGRMYKELNDGRNGEFEKGSPIRPKVQMAGNSRPASSAMSYLSVASGSSRAPSAASRVSGGGSLTPRMVASPRSGSAASQASHASRRHLPAALRPQSSASVAASVISRKSETAGDAKGVAEEQPPAV